ncbi:MAG: hypothetical protein HRU47_02250 [Verrucomicrobiales bacterium]|nr:hypothetical protein [Verrucomicrobiales bacterium]
MNSNPNFIAATFTALVLFLSLSSGQCESVTFEDGKKAWTYEKIQVMGWNLYIEKSISKDKALNDVILKEVREGIKRFIKIVPPDAIKFLQTIPIWASNEPTYPMRKNERGVIPFHRDKTWLRDHDLNPHMAPGVHIINPRAALLDHKIFEWGPMTMLHELAHAYHNVKLGLSNPDIRSAYGSAMARGLYLKVPDRKFKNKKVKAYAASNKEEYFAEVTEAYFGKNDWFPHNRKELKEYDPKAYLMVEKVWGVTKNTP